MNTKDFFIVILFGLEKKKREKQEPFLPRKHFISLANGTQATRSYYITAASETQIIIVL
jgi:hypothetical protein